ncbi:hypothetical protein C8J57DRAFT_1230841 [Mycena rebaudengoi]|nr:hypothetical protein C8J57DRAFT_1230841 [Mycena rebaudengoi]
MAEENSTNLTQIWWKPSVLHGDTDFQRDKMPGVFDSSWVVIDKAPIFHIDSWMAFYESSFVTFPGSTYSVPVGTSQNQRRVELSWLGLAWGSRISTPEVYPLTMSMLEMLDFVMGTGSKTPGTGLVLPCEALAHKPSLDVC